MNETSDFTKKAEKFLETAKLAFNSGDYDSCVSRCYYAMFFMTEAVLLTKGMKASSHKGVISLFGEHFVVSEFQFIEIPTAPETTFRCWTAIGTSPIRVSTELRSSAVRREIAHAPALSYYEAILCDTSGKKRRRSAYLVKSGVFEGKFGKILRHAYDKRLNGDYGVGFAVVEKEADDMLKTAQDFVQKAKDYLRRETE